jgi:uncharacterized protein YfaA (DUF2138 family)
MILLRGFHRVKFPCGHRKPVGSFADKPRSVAAFQASSQRHKLKALYMLHGQNIGAVESKNSAVRLLFRISQKQMLH